MIQANTSIFASQVTSSDCMFCLSIPLDLIDKEIFPELRTLDQAKLARPYHRTCSIPTSHPSLAQVWRAVACLATRLPIRCHTLVLASESNASRSSKMSKAQITSHICAVWDKVKRPNLAWASKGNCKTLQFKVDCFGAVRNCLASDFEIHSWMMFMFCYCWPHVFSTCAREIELWSKSTCDHLC